MPKQNDNNQLALFGAIPAQLTVSVDKVFASEPIKDKSGAVIGTKIGMRKNVEIAKDLTLTGKKHKDELEAAIRAERVTKLRALKAYIAGLDDDHVFTKAQLRTLANGTERQTFVIDKSAAKLMATEEEYAKAMGLNNVQELRAKIRELRAQQATDVDATVQKPAELPAPKPENAVDESKAADAEAAAVEAEIAELEAEIKANQAK